MDEFFKRAITNVIRHGDTDIFPFPVENHIFFDKAAETLTLLQEIHRDFDGHLSRHPPAHDAALAPVNYTGFRWATQMDPLWNLYFLALVLAISDKIEAARLPISIKRVFSYRYRWKEETADIFDDASSWRDFMECSLERAALSKFVVVCDISEFYPRLGHHRLENALLQLGTSGDRSFRSVDVRQLIIYSALNYVSKRYQIEKLGLFNPRVGISATISVDDLCAEISSRKSSELFSEIVAAISRGDISR